MKRTLFISVAAVLATYANAGMGQAPPPAPDSASQPAAEPAASAATGNPVNTQAPTVTAPTSTSTASPEGEAPATATRATSSAPAAGEAGTAVALAAPAADAQPPVAAPPPDSRAANAAVSAAPAELAPADAAPPGPTLKFYGFGRLDAAYATGRMQNLELGLWARQPDANGDYEDEITLNPRWSRFGLDWDAGDLGGESAKISAKIEIDFHGGGSQSRATPRMTHAYGQVQLGDFTILGGQTWDLYAPLIAGGMEQSIFWYGGNLGDRRPQLRVTYAPKFGPATLVVAAAAAQSGAVDMEDLDADTVMDGNAWARPAGQGLVELKLDVDALGEKPIRIGGSGHYGGKTLSVGGEDEDFRVFAVVGHLEFPIRFVTLRGEVWTGENLNDLRGGIGQGLALTDEDGDGLFETGKEIAARGGWLQLSAAPVDWYSVAVGVSRDKLCDPAPGQRAKNDTLDLTNVFSPWKPVKIGLVYTHYWTEYVTGRDASVNRFMASTMVSF